jgi:hypothetical protein
MKWPGIRIPRAILSLLDRKGLHFCFFDDKTDGDDLILLFYEQNPAGCGLDFDDYPEDKPDFGRHAVELHCLNHVVDTKKTPLPPFEDLAEAVTTLIAIGFQHNKEPRKELEILLYAEGATKESLVTSESLICLFGALIRIWAPYFHLISTLFPPSYCNLV